MDKFTKKLEILEELIFSEIMYEDDDYTEAQKLIQEDDFIFFQREKHRTTN